MERLRKMRGQSDRMAMRISGIDDAYGAFLNDSAFAIRLNAVTWPTVTHYLLGQQYPEAVPFGLREAASVEDARAVAQSHGLPGRHKWEVVRDDYLFRALYAKFTQHLNLEEHLLRTGNIPIVFGSEDDSYYGIGPKGAGYNMFGRLLMRVRRKIAAAQAAGSEGLDAENLAYRLEMLVRAEPDNTGHLVSLADERFEQGNYRDALGLSQRIVALDPDCEWGYTIMVRALMRLCRFEEAVEPLKALIHIDPEDSDYYRWMSDVQARLDRWVAAQVYEWRARLLEESDDD